MVTRRKARNTVGVDEGSQTLNRTHLRGRSGRSGLDQRDNLCNKRKLSKVLRSRDGRTYVSGKSMNIEQAVRSFCIVNGMEMQSDEIRCVMESAISTK